MSAKIIDLSARRNGKERSHDVAEQPAKPRRATRDLQAVAVALDARTELFDDLLRTIRLDASSFVANWYEAFAFGIKHAEYCLRELEEMWTPEKLQWMKDNPDPKQPDAYENVTNLIAGFKGARYFYERCAQIYAEEWHELFELDLAARERAAERIEQEFGKDANDVPEALRDNAMQIWAGNFDWR